MQSDRVILDIGSVGDFGCSRFCVAAQERDFFSLFRDNSLYGGFHNSRTLPRCSPDRQYR